MKVLAYIGGGILLLAVLIGLPWLIMGNEFFLTKYFLPRAEQVRRETFEQSKAYNQGMVQELDAMYLEYTAADEDHKDAIASVVRHRTADFDTSKLPDYLKKFVEQTRQ